MNTDRGSLAARARQNAIDGRAVIKAGQIIQPTVELIEFFEAVASLLEQSPEPAPPLRGSILESLRQGQWSGAGTRLSSDDCADVLGHIRIKFCEPTSIDVAYRDFIGTGIGQAPDSWRQMFEGGYQAGFNAKPCEPTVDCKIAARDLHYTLIEQYGLKDDPVSNSTIRKGLERLAGFPREPHESCDPANLTVPYNDLQACATYAMKLEEALRWLAESANPEKLTGAFAVDHARRALRCPVDPN